MTDERIAIIGAGPAGMEAAITAGDLGAEAIVIEKRDVAGGMPDEANYAALTPDLRDTDEAMAPMIEEFETHENIDVRTGSRVTEAAGEAGDFTLTVENGEGTDELDVDSVIVATGFDHFDPSEETQQYGYAEFDDVITLPDAEEMLKDGSFERPSTGEDPESVCFIQCVGSRDRQIGNQWCSKVCCGIATKEAIEVKEEHPDANVIIFYIDMRMYGFWEDELYWKAQEEHNVRFVRGIATEITQQGDQVVVKGEDTTMGRPYEIPMDVVVLSVGMEPSTGSLEVADQLDLPLEDHGFIETTSGPLDTVETSREGIYVAGAAAGPKDLEDSISMAGSAAAKAVSAARSRPTPATDGGQTDG